MTSPTPTVTPNSWDFLRDPQIAARGFREYDARWKYPEEINLPGMTALGLGLGTQMQARGLKPEIVVGNDYRDYSLAIKQALAIGLMQAGINVRDIGPALSPMAYFAQFHLDVPAVAMVTASHNPNGWTGVKMGFDRPLTHGPDEMAELRDIVLGGHGVARPGGSYATVAGVEEAYLDDLAGDFRLARPLRVVCATGNGTAGRFAPALLARIGADEEKYAVLDRLVDRLQARASAGETLAGHAIAGIVTVNGARVQLAHGGWALVRASSNTPNLVVVCESPDSREDLRAIFHALDAVIRTEAAVGAYDQSL